MTNVAVRVLLGCCIGLVKPLAVGCISRDENAFQGGLSIPFDISLLGGHVWDLYLNENIEEKLKKAGLKMNTDLQAVGRCLMVSSYRYGPKVHYIWNCY